MAATLIVALRRLVWKDKTFLSLLEGKKKLTDVIIRGQAGTVAASCKALIISVVKGDFLRILSTL